MVNGGFERREFEQQHDGPAASPEPTVQPESTAPQRSGQPYGWPFVPDSVPAPASASSAPAPTPGTAPPGGSEPGEPVPLAGRLEFSDAPGFSGAPGPTGPPGFDGPPRLADPPGFTDHGPQPNMRADNGFPRSPGFPDLGPPLNPPVGNGPLGGPEPTNRAAAAFDAIGAPTAAFGGPGASTAWFSGIDAPTTAFGAQHDQGPPGTPAGNSTAPLPGATFPPQQPFPPRSGVGPGLMPDGQFVPGPPQPQSDWAPPGAMPPPSARIDRAPRRRKPLLLTGIGVVVVAAIGVTAAVVAGRDSESPAAEGATTPSMVSALRSGEPTTPPHSPSRHPGPPPAQAPPPTISGYQVVLVRERGAAYDVPPDWQVDPAGTIVWGAGSNPLEVAGLSQDGENYCPGYTRTNAFLTMSPETDPAAAAADIGKRMARFGWSDATVTDTSAAEPMDSRNGQLHGTYLETTGRAAPPAPGCATTFAIYTFAFPGENGSFVMTVAADTGVDHSVTEATAKRVLSSIRPLPAR